MIKLGNPFASKKVALHKLKIDSIREKGYHYDETSGLVTLWVLSDDKKTFDVKHFGVNEVYKMINSTKKVVMPDITHAAKLLKIINEHK